METVTDISLEGFKVVMLFSVRKDEEGYYLTLSQNEYCCPQEAVRFYIALRKKIYQYFFTMLR